jgi:AraC-type transcriptional regulator N-terminus
MRSLKFTLGLFLFELITVNVLLSFLAYNGLLDVGVRTGICLILQTPCLFLQICCVVTGHRGGRSADNRIDRRGKDRMRTAGGTQVLELRDLIAQLTPRDGDHETSIDSLYLIRYSSSKTTDYAVLTPGFCIAAQGQKEVLLGEDAVYYQGTGHHIVSSTQLPFRAAFCEGRQINPT